MFSSLVGCALTVGFGGSVGMEGPIAAIGAALGDNVASLSNADYKRRMILICCGAACAISAIFKAPLAEPRVLRRGVRTRRPELIS